MVIIWPAACRVTVFQTPKTLMLTAMAPLIRTIAMLTYVALSSLATVFLKFTVEPVQSTPSSTLIDEVNQLWFVIVCVFCFIAG